MDATLTPQQLLELSSQLAIRSTALARTLQQGKQADSQAPSYGPKGDDEVAKTWAKGQREAIFMLETERDARQRELHKLHERVKSHPPIQVPIQTSGSEQDGMDQVGKVAGGCHTADEEEGGEMGKMKMAPPVVSAVMTKARVDREIDGLQTLLRDLGEERVALEKRITREEELQRDHRVLQEGLRVARAEVRKELDDHASGLVSPGSRSKALVEEARNKVRERRKQIARWARSLVTFTAENFPAIRMDPETGARLEEGERAKDESEGNKVSLSHMLEDLMGLALSNPEDPYLELKIGQFWPPYVELLIRAGVARRHASDARLLRLMDFYV